MLKRVTIAILGSLICLTAGSKELVTRFTGDGNTTTAEFEVRAPWILDWRVNSNFRESMAVEISLVDGTTGFHKGLILQTKRPGNGVRMFREGGTYRFRISTTFARWDLKVEELTPEEAEQYTPR